MRFVSSLCSIIIIASVHLPGALRATGLYEDAPSFFAAADTTRTRLIIRHTELERGSWRASLIAGELDFRMGRRYVVRFGFEFPALRGNREVEYGMGDIRLRAAARIFGDTLDTTGLFFRSDVRIPTGAKKLRPFCNASLDGGAGFEVRAARGEFAARGAVLYTLAGERLAGTDFENDNAVTLAASLSLPIPKVASVTAVACFVRFDGGARREVFQCSLNRNLSPPLVLGIDGVVETGTERERIFDSSITVSLAYRFPPRALPASRKSDEH